MKDINGKRLKLQDPVWFSPLHCSGSGTIVKFSPKKVTCHVLCAGETIKGLHSKDILFWKDKTI
jgi:hypothetical protein